MTNNTVIRRATAAGLLATPFYLALIVALGAMEPGFSHRTSLTSMLGGVPNMRESDFNLGDALSRPPASIDIVMPEVNARRGRILFITKACVICHQLNGVGGTAAPALDRPDPGLTIDPLEFSARMWRGARAMTALQSIELGYVIDLDGQDIADLAAFTASEEESSLLTLDSVSEEMQDWFIDAPHWKTDEWEEYLEQGERIPFDDDMP